MKIRLTAVFLFAFGLYAQQTGPPGTFMVTADPSGACSIGSALQYNVNNGNLWGCNNGTWTQISGGGGGGAVWGAITGTLTDQTDLNTALGLKVPTSRTVAGHALSGNVTVACGDLSNAGALCSSTDAANLTGTINNARLPSAISIPGPLTLTGSGAGAIDMATGVAPSNPPAGQFTVFFNSANSNHLSILNAAGSVTDLQAAPVITGGTCTNQAVTAVNTAGVPTCTTLTSAYVDTTIAKTGTDMNTSNQVTQTHLAAALPVNQGGTGTTSTLTGLMRGGSPQTAAELSGDCTTSGSNAVVCTKSNGVSLSAFATATGALNPQTATYQALASDFTNLKTITVASGTFTITLVASGSQPAAGQYIWVLNYGSGVVTIARSGQNINGGTASITLPAGSATAATYAKVWSDGTNYYATCPPAATTTAYPLTFVQESSGTSGTATSYTFTFPQTTAASGNTVFMFVAADGSQAITFPAGWTVDINVSQASFSRFAVLHKTTAADTSAAFSTSTNANYAVYFFEVTGAHALDQSSTGGVANAQNITLPSITPTANSVMFAFACAVLNSTASGNVSPANPMPINPAWRALNVQPVAGNGVRVLYGLELLTAATNTVTRPPQLYLNGTNFFASGGVAYATFSIL